MRAQSTIGKCTDRHLFTNAGLAHNVVRGRGGRGGGGLNDKLGGQKGSIVMSSLTGLYIICRIIIASPLVPSCHLLEDRHLDFLSPTMYGAKFPIADWLRQRTCFLKGTFDNQEEMSTRD